MTTERRTFTREFKRHAVQLVTDQGFSYAEAARKLGIREALLRKWKHKLDAQGPTAFPGHGQRTPLDAELEQLRAENKRLKMERDILKKSVSLFAKELL
jgi:transposase